MGRGGRGPVLREGGCVVRGYIPGPLFGGCRYGVGGEDQERLGRWPGGRGAEDQGPAGREARPTSEGPATAVGRGYTPDGFSGRGRDGARREIKSRRARRPGLRGGQGVGAGEGEAEAGAAGGDGDVFEVGAVGAAQLAGDVQAQAGAVLGGGEEGAEQLRHDGVGDAGA